MKGRIPALLLCGVAASVGAAPSPGIFENEVLRLHVRTRTPEQIAGFYEARGFPAAMIEQLRGRCFLTVTIHNKSRDILWLDLERWEFTAGGQPVRRVTRPQWRALWQRMDAPRPAQATFRWTLLPERLDFRPAEAEGGNIVLPRVAGTLRLRARFDTGADRKGEPVAVQVDGLRCPPAGNREATPR